MLTGLLSAPQVPELVQTMVIEGMIRRGWSLGWLGESEDHEPGQQQARPASRSENEDDMHEDGQKVHLVT